MLLALPVGAIFTIVGYFLWKGATRDAALRDRMLAAPWSSIGRAPRHGTIKVCGVASAGEEGTVRAPFSGREAIVYRVTVQEWQPEDEGEGRWGMRKGRKEEKDLRSLAPLAKPLRPCGRLLPWFRARAE